MFFQTTQGLSLAQSQEAFAACLTLLLMGGIVYMFSNSKPTFQRAFLRLMFQPLLATSVFFALWWSGMLFSLYLAFR